MSVAACVLSEAEHAELCEQNASVQTIYVAGKRDHKPFLPPSQRSNTFCIYQENLKLIVTFRP